MTAGDHSVLDDPDARERLDPGGMLGAIDALPEQCRTAWEAAQGFSLPWDEAPEWVVILGMGGSAIAGDYFRALLALESSVPVFNVRSYDLPPFVDERTLVIASSFSGETEEVLAAFEQALGTPARKLVITTGGRLMATARANGVPAFTFAYRGEARAAIGWGLMPLLAFAEKLGLTQGMGRDVEEAVSVMSSLRGECGAGVPASHNRAKQLALRLNERLPVIYGAGPLIEVARRWKTQLNETAKTWAFCEEMPEAQHNAIVALGLPKPVAAATTAVFLEPSPPAPFVSSPSPDLPLRAGSLPTRARGEERMRQRFEFMRRLFHSAGVPHETARAGGSSALAQMLSLTMLGDYVGAYLALLYGVDPTPTEVIDELKAWLGESP